MLYQFRIALVVALILIISMSAFSKTLELRHSKTSVTSVRFTRDGRRLISAGFDGTVVAWNREAGTQIWRKDLDEPSRISGSYTISHIGGMDLTADDRTIAISYSQAQVVGKTLRPGNMHRISLLDSVTGDVRRTLQGHTDQIGRIAFSPDGRFLLSESADKTARLWNMDKGNEVLRVDLKEKGAAIAFSPTGKEFAIATQPVYGSQPESIVALYEVDSGRLVREFPRRTNFTSSLAFSPDGKLLAIAGGDAFGAQVDIWELTAPQPKISFSEPRREVSSVAFSRDGSVLAIGGYGNSRGLVEVRDLIANGKPRAFRFESAVTALAFSQEGKQLVVGTDKGRVVVLRLQGR